jgi:hypothetical protein
MISEKFLMVSPELPSAIVYLENGLFTACAIYNHPKHLKRARKG